ncbi:MAG: hypothetical protein IKM08_02040 [Clostridia bacterium]|nr:hypothetical protein [Clostridia bacterium]
MKKLLALLLCLSMLAAPLLSCGSDPAPAPEGGGSDEIPVTYDAVIDKYTAVLTALKDGTPVADMERTGADTLGADIMNAIYDTVAACEEPLDMGYGTKDIDGDGTDELLLMSERGVSYVLFTQKNGKILFLIDLGAQGAIDEEGNIYKVGYDAESKTSLSTLCRLQNGVLISYEYGETRTSDDTGVHFSYFKTVNGERVTIEESEHSAFYNMYFKCDGSFLRIATRMTRQAHFRYTPALAREPDEAAVTVDYSSYEAVLETYKKIVAALPEFDLLWASNGYHNRFMTDNSPEYEYTDRLLQACALYDEGGALSFGYAKKDLNGDGSDELMLMTEGREALAVFTLQKGKPALIYAANATTRC